MIVAFHSNTMSPRGSENALWDYANFNESTLGNQSVICHLGRLADETNPVFTKWKARFPLIPYHSRRDLSQKLRSFGVEVLYQIKPGPFDGFLIPGVKNCIHSMFLSDEFHGDRFAYVSSWSSKVMTGKEDSFVPHYVPKLESKENLREELKIPSGAKVFGRHGGWDTFNIPFVRNTVVQHARKNPEDHFVFLNTEPIRGTENLANVHYIGATVDSKVKARFFATCDAMLHARWHGETFGLAVGEFAVLGKPVITFGGSRERAHLEMLGDRGLIYEDAKQLRNRLETVQPGKVCGTGYESWADPRQVMAIFRGKFLD